MECNVKTNKYESFLISENNIVISVNKELLDIIACTQDELLGKSLLEVSRILRIDSQVNLEELKGEATIFLFSKELIPIEGKISCKIIDHGLRRIFSFEIYHFSMANDKFNLISQLGTYRGDGVAFFTYPCLTLINCNQNFLDFLNPPFNIRTNSIGKDLVEVVPEYLLFGYEEIKSHIDKLGTSYYLDEKCVDIKNSGKEYWNITLVPIFAGFKVGYIILSLEDVTEKLVNRNMLEQRNEQLEAVIDKISDEIIIFDKYGYIIHSNMGSDKQFVSDNPNIYNFNNILEPTAILDKNNQVVEFRNLPFKRVSRGEVVLGYEMKVKTKMGILHREVNGTPIYDKEGNFSGGVMVYRDIKDRLELEEARLIKTQNDLLSKVVESLELEFVRCSYPDLEIISTNGSRLDGFKEKIHGIKPCASQIGKSYFDVYLKNQENKIKLLNYNLIEKGKYSFVDYATHMIDGQQRFFKTIIQSILGLNNNIVELIFISIDITDEVKAKNKLEETLEMQNQMFTNISHELKTPLSVIFSASQLTELYLERETNVINKSSINKNINIIKQNCYRFLKLINNIIDLSRIESGFYKPNFKNTNIVEIVEEVVESVRSYVEMKGLHIIFNTEIEEKIIATDVDKLERIILNLISNAAKFSPKGSNICIEIREKTDSIMIIVRDCGVGMKREDLNTIFDKYKKVDNTLIKNTEGSGIGLALVKTMVDLMDGEISVKSELGKGSLFTVSLPVKLLDECQAPTTLKARDDRIEQINIEFSDIYTK